MHISNTIIPSLTRVTKSSKKDSPDNVHGLVEDFSMWELLKDEGIYAAFYVLSCAIIFCSLLHPYQNLDDLFWKSILHLDPALASALAVKTMSWVVLFTIWQDVALAKSKDIGKPWSKSLYKTYIDLSYNVQFFSFKTLVLPMYNELVKILCGKIDGYVTLLPHEMYEFPFLSFENETIVDSSHISGHYVVYNDIVLGPSQISGIFLDEETFTANARVDGITEKEPCLRIFVGSGSKKQISSPGNKPGELPGTVVGNNFAETAHTHSPGQYGFFEENPKMNVTWENNDLVGDENFAAVENGTMQEQERIKIAHDD